MRIYDLINNTVTDLRKHDKPLIDARYMTEFPNLEERCGWLFMAETKGNA